MARATTSHEVIDLTQSPEPEFIDLASDDEAAESRPTSRRSRKRSRNEEDGTNESTAGPSNITSRNGSGRVTPTENKGMEGKERERKKRRRTKKRKVVDAEVSEEGELLDADDDLNDGEYMINGGKSDKGKAKDPMQTRQSLLNRIEGASEQLLAQSPSKSSSTKNTESKLNRAQKRKKRAKEKERGERAGSRSRSKSPGHASVNSLFFVDTIPLEIPTPVKTKSSADTVSGAPINADEQADDAPLLLPAHVSVIGENANGIPIEIISPPAPNAGEEDYIEYLDYDDDRRAGVVRYFEDATEKAEGSQPRIVCKKCGAEGEHKTRECPVLICLTCGARDEHSTRSCPISKVCYSCGMKGHINRDCPARYSRAALGTFDDCDRCGSTIHNANECPTLWRMYEYVDDDHRNDILRSRENKVDLPIGQGGEGYIAIDEYCYNCGACGHLGDDCSDLPHPYGHPKEPSAFSDYNTQSGPFFDPNAPEAKKSSRSQKPKKSSRQDVDSWADGHGFTLPLDVGKQAKKKERARLESQSRARDREEDEEDWFAGNRSKANNKDRGRNNSNGRNGGGQQANGSGKKITFGALAKDDGRYSKSGMSLKDRIERGPPSRSTLPDDLPPPMRETDVIQIKGAASRRDGRDNRDYRNNDYRDRDRNRDRRRYDRDRPRRDYYERDRDRDYERYDHGPRYRGGYSR
ncbi:hypothetical protein C8Q75DRAFT_372465 [Abortiporus biennis]|nr:hypothetical protein C8Q75DRAFT_372465 [Abortiporus biennis]